MLKGSCLCAMTAETLAGLKTKREVNAPRKRESCSLEARKETPFGTCCRYLEASNSTSTWKDGGYFWSDFLGVFRQDPLLIQPGEVALSGGSAPHCVFNTRKSSPTVLLPNNSVQMKISFPSVTRKFTPPETCPAFPGDHLTDPSSETLPLVHSKQGLFWIKQGRAAQPDSFSLRELKEPRRSRRWRSGSGAGNPFSICGFLKTHSGLG